MNQRDRPPHAAGTDGPARAGRSAALVLTAVGVGVVAVRYPSLPPVVPTHFDALGRPDAFGPRSSVLGLCGLWVVLLLGLVALSRRPRAMNYPVPVTEENAARLYRVGERTVVATALATALTFAGLVLWVLGAQGAGQACVAGGVVALLATCVVGVVAGVRAGAPRRDATRAPGGPAGP